MKIKNFRKLCLAGFGVFIFPMFMFGSGGTCNGQSYLVCGNAQMNQAILDGRANCCEGDIYTITDTCTGNISYITQGTSGENSSCIGDV